MRFQHISIMSSDITSILNVDTTSIGSNRGRSRSRNMKKSTINSRQQQSRQQQQAQRDPDGYLSLPYVDETLCAKVNGVTKKSGMDIKVAWKSENTLKRSLVESDISCPECPSGRRTCNACSSGVEGKCTMAGVVYCITCNLCTSIGDEVTYVGECKRPIRLRFNEHVLNAKHSSPDTPFGDHFRAQHAGESLPDHPLSVESFTYIGLKIIRIAK